ncbi:hypothetical protein DICVIV_09816 [Dictyocaulus viviparus]|uniref:Uncharacterized protein n=1 Tax=Dictyocaulus viviparus TaxID=29172 RepID=A0A0D8XHQ4_DICVI|nr:hypothetical protein DICVIV_09816 [Dictyocaulus viviparus]
MRMTSFCNMVDINSSSTVDNARRINDGASNITENSTHLMDHHKLSKRNNEVNSSQEMQAFVKNLGQSSDISELFEETLSIIELLEDNIVSNTLSYEPIRFMLPCFLDHMTYVNELASSMFKCLRLLQQCV